MWVCQWLVHVSTLKQNFTNEKYLRYDSVYNVWKITAVNLYDCKNNYSTFSLIWLVWGWTCAEILNSLDYQPLPVQVICYYCSYTWAVKLVRGVFHFDISFICWFWVMRVLCCIFLSLCNWISWWNRKKWEQIYHNGWWTYFWRPFQHFPKICLFHSWSFFAVKSKIFGHGNTLLTYRIARFSGLLDITLKEFCCKKFKITVSLLKHEVHKKKEIFKTVEL